ncbi:MAG: DNA-3-methyladenine glycosylase, partial [Candidatus Thermoplasmatota archaeon]
LSGKIVETEAYYGISDPASRAAGGKITKLNKWMWCESGTVFVYMVHGNWLFNIITGKENLPQGILIRALEPINGLDFMFKNRKTNKIENLTSGPGKLTQAFGITSMHNGMNVTNKSSEIIVVEGGNEDFEIVSSHRIGVKKDLNRMLRFYIKNNRFVSRK